MKGTSCQQNHVKWKVCFWSLLYCIFRYCNLKKNSKQNSEKVSMKSSFTSNITRIIEPSNFFMTYGNYCYFISNFQMPLVLKIQNLETIFQTKWGVFSNSAWCKSLVSYRQGSRMCWRENLLIQLLAIRSSRYVK